MRVAVFDCPFGIAGDMTVGALIDAGMPFEIVKSEIAKLNLKGVRLSCREVRCGKFRAKKFSVHLTRKPKHPASLHDIEKLIRRSRLHGDIQKKAVAIFRNLGRAEAKVHGVPVQKIHFHEIGAIDSIIDIVATAVCFHALKIRKAYVRHLRVGRGIQRTSHGRMPIPVPGAYELLKGFYLEQADHREEMVTPTGAAILATLCEKTFKIPRIKISKIGYGAGDRKFFGHPGFLRLSLGDSSPSS